MANHHEPEGFRIPIHRSLTEPIMLGGVPRTIAITNGIAVVAFVMGAQNLWVLPLGVVSHLILVALHRKDKQFLTVLKRNLSRSSHLRS
jgi:type IV secretory pathway TrbD component